MTFFETAGQARTFLFLLYAGFLSGALYDGAAWARRRLPRWLGIPLDILWCLLTALMCAAALAKGGEDRARFYALLGLCCGGVLYSLGLRAACRGLGRMIRGAVRRKTEST